MIIQGNNTTYGKCVNCVQGVITEIFTNIIAELIKIANEDDFNEFEELRLQLENPN